MIRRNSKENESLDRLGRVILHSAALSEVESAQASEAPFLFARVRARIAEERGNQNGSGFSVLMIARRAVPAMALIALLAAMVMFWSWQASVTPGWNGLDYEALADTGNPGIEQMVLSRNNLSRDDVFSIVLEHSEREKR